MKSVKKNKKSVADIKKKCNFAISNRLNADWITGRGV